MPANKVTVAGQHHDPSADAKSSSVPSSLRDGGRPQSPQYDPQASLILRIKRKRGADPITALRIETLINEGLDASEAQRQVNGVDQTKAAGQAQNLNLGTSPEDSIQSRPKRRLTDRGIFKLAETVSLASFDNAEETKRLEERIAKLKHPTQQQANVSQIGEADSREPVMKTNKEIQSKQQQQDKGSVRASPANVRYKVISSQTKAPRRSLFDALKANNNSSGSLKLKAQRHAARTAGRHRRALDDVRVKPYDRPHYIDAVMEGDKNRDTKAAAAAAAASHSTSLQANDGEKDEEMSTLNEGFAALLGDYLKKQDLEPPSDFHDAIHTMAQNKSDSTPFSDEVDDDDEDYVYDIYYRVREYAHDAPSAYTAANVGLQPSEVAGHEQDDTLGDGSDHPASNSQTLVPMATLVGLSSDFELGDEEEIEKGSRLVSEELLDSDDPYEEGEDEDSNDEDFYRNDYPEQEANDDEDLDASAWGWSGPRRLGQRRDGSSSDGLDDDDDGDSEEDF